MSLGYILCSTLVLACNSALDQTREMEVPDLLQAVVDKDLKDVPQCKQDGVTKCTAVSTDMGLIRSLKSGDKIGLLQGLDISMELRRDPEVTSSGGLSLPLLLGDGGEANVVVGTSGSIYGSIKPVTGNVIYAIESCGQDCNVLLERSSDYFNQFID